MVSTSSPPPADVGQRCELSQPGTHGMLFVRDIRLIRTVSPVDALEILPVNQTPGVKGLRCSAPTESCLNQGRCEATPDGNEECNPLCARQHQPAPSVILLSVTGG
ncbi:hypothetical protein INR49_017388 [Caranx melampygus]|nr:hypothetical protein INR49_017388 [Caranx melampygus]